MIQEDRIKHQDMQEILRAMQGQMRNNAFHHLDFIGLRSLRMLQYLELYKDTAVPLGRETDINVLRDLHHPARQMLRPGPLVLYVKDCDEENRYVDDVPLLLMADRREAREAALVCLEQLITENPWVLVDRTKERLKGKKGDLLSEDPKKWRPASIILTDALNDDLMMALSAVRQCLTCEPAIKSGLDFYVPKVLHPSLASVGLVNVPAVQGERNPQVLQDLVVDIVSRAQTVNDLCAYYLELLGFVPLAPPYSLASALYQWLESHHVNDVWSEVWAWADEASTPIAQYQACTVFVLHPELIPDGKLESLWMSIISIVQIRDESGTAMPKHEPWILRRELTKHYLLHLEAMLPDTDSANHSVLAWWLAEKVAGLFPSSDKIAKYYRENWIEPAAEHSGYLWMLACSPVKLSYLRYVTIAISFPWAVALLSLMGDKLEALEPDKQDSTIRSIFNEALIGGLFISAPLSEEQAKQPVFAQELLLTKTAQKWSEFQESQQGEFVCKLVDACINLGDNDTLCDSLRSLNEGTSVDQRTTCLVLKAKALTDRSIGDDIWSLVSDAEWQGRVFATAETEIQILLVECFSILQLENGGEWHSRLPHFFAELCEKAEDEERRRELFLFTLHFSMAAESVSAIKRLLSGRQKARFIMWVEEFREHIIANRKQYPPWVASKVRAMMASLYVE